MKLSREFPTDSSEVDHQQVELAQQVTRAVATGTYREVQDLHVQADGNHIVLSGRCRTYYVKQLATHAVFDAFQEVELTNDIEVG